MNSVTERLDRVPPFLCRMVARDKAHRGRRLSLVEISIASGLSYGAVRRLSHKRTWANVPPCIIDRFASACGVDLLHLKRTIFYLKRTLKSPNGYKCLSSKKGHEVPEAIIRMLKEYLQ